MDTTTLDAEDFCFVGALPTIRALAEALEAEGFSLAEIADAFLTAGLSIGTAATSPAVTARTLQLLALRFAAEAAGVDGSDTRH